MDKGSGKPASASKPRSASKAKKSGSKESGDLKAELPKHVPLDVSNGKARFKKYQNIEYDSVTQGAWLEVQVIMVREDGGIMIDLKDRYWFDVDEQWKKFREGSRKAWLVDSELEYWSVSNQGWTRCSVCDRNPQDNSIQIDIKKGYWMSVAEQDEKLRLPLYDGGDEIVWKTGRMLQADPPDVSGAEKMLRKLLQEASDHTLAMESLAAILRDYFGDLPGAEALYRQALNENPFELKVLSDLGDLLRVQGQESEADEMHKRWRKVRDKLKDIEEELG